MPGLTESKDNAQDYRQRGMLLGSMTLGQIVADTLGVLSLSCVLQQIQQAAKPGSRLNPRKKRPTTSQLLLAGTDGRGG